MKTKHYQSPAFSTYRAYRLFWQSIDLIFPPACAGCGKIGFRWCPDCQKQVEILGDEVCPVCGDPQKTKAKCWKCRNNQPPYRALRSWSVFNGPTREALHRLKYRRDLGLGDTLSERLIPFLVDLQWKIDLIVPVPLGSARLKERGYNQAALLAWPVAARLGIHYSSTALLRIKESKSQVGLSLAERRANVDGIFKAGSRLVMGKSVLVIDDVTTTGATIESCAAALSQAGATDIYGLTFARAMLIPH